MTNDQVDEWAIRDTAKHLADLYRELDAAKYSRQQARGERIMKPRPGPQAPGNWLMISRDAELVDHLVEMVCDIRNHIAPAYTVGRKGEVLAEWIAFNAAAIAELDFADDLHDLMTTQVRRITAWLHPAGIDEVAARPEPRHVSGIIIDRMRQLGHHLTREQLRTWAARGQITSHIRGDYRATYLLSEVHNQIEKGDPDTS